MFQIHKTIKKIPYVKFIQHSIQLIDVLIYTIRKSTNIQSRVCQYTILFIWVVSVQSRVCVNTITRMMESIVERSEHRNKEEMSKKEGLGSAEKALGSGGEASISK